MERMFLIACFDTTTIKVLTSIIIIAENSKKEKKLEFVASFWEIQMKYTTNFSKLKLCDGIHS